ncbi:MAG: S-layer homology domain-containing protein [Oscillospiraceae bacterium]|nr:S-layer homology domain-containing protein [Oscillospiraceae bacterium]
MKKHRILVIFLSIIAVLAIFLLPAAAADQQEAELWVFPAEESSGDTSGAWAYFAPKAAGKAVTTYTTTQATLDMIAEFEGFSATPVWDTYWLSIGYGSRLTDAEEMFPEIAETKTITKEQAMALLKKEMGEVDTAVNSFLSRKGIPVNQNQFDALASFTYNVGIGWTTYKNSDGTWCKLHALLLEGPSAWTSERVYEAFGTWVNDGNGNPLPGLVRRRKVEAELFMTPVADSAGPFRDVVSGSWYYDAVMKAYELGYMSGMGEGTFEPNGGLTRAQVVKILANVEQADLSVYTCGSFRDVTAGTWYCSAVGWASEKGYVSGFEDGTFRPNEKITREQLCSILGRYLRGKGYAAGSAAADFADMETVASYARGNVEYCASLGLISGMGDGTFSPKSGATRAQAASIFVRLHDLMN